MSGSTRRARAGRASVGERRLGDPPAFPGFDSRSFRDHALVPGGGRVLDVCLRWTAGWALGLALALQAWVGPRLFWTTPTGTSGMPILEGALLGLLLGGLTAPLLAWVTRWRIRRAAVALPGASRAELARLRPPFRHLGRWTARLVFVATLVLLIAVDGWS